MESGTGTGTRNRGFASMDSHKQKEIARKGGRAAHQKGTAHEFTSAEARAAGRKGGERVSANREHMSRIGRIGGKSSAGRRQPGSGGGDGEPRMHPGEATAHPVQSAQGSAGRESSGESSGMPHGNMPEGGNGNGNGNGNGDAPGMSMPSASTMQHEAERNQAEQAAVPSPS